MIFQSNNQRFISQINSKAVINSWYLRLFDWNSRINILLQFVIGLFYILIICIRVIWYLYVFFFKLNELLISF